MSASKRIAKEYADCTTSPPAGMTISLADENDLHKWHVVLEGPKESLYAGGTFGLVVDLPADYPFKPPAVHFATRIYHPNVTNDSLGQICVGVLKSETWKPALRLTNVLETLRQLLVEPNPDDPIETRIAEEYRNSRSEFEKQVKFYVGKYAKGTPSFSA